MFLTIDLTDIIDYFIEKGLYPCTCGDSFISITNTTTPSMTDWPHSSSTENQ